MFRFRFGCWPNKSADAAKLTVDVVPSIVCGEASASVVVSVGIVSVRVLVTRNTNNSKGMAIARLRPELRLSYSDNLFIYSSSFIPFSARRAA